MEGKERKITEKPGEMTPQQKIFLLSQARLRRFDQIEMTRQLTPEEKREKDEIRQSLYENIVQFGMRVAKKRMSRYMIDGDAYEEVQQSLAVMFFEMLPMYNPRVSTPTTFFVRYFNQVISEYLLANSQHLSQYDAHNLSKVRGAIHYYESLGIKWDVHMIVNRTGLSQKVVIRTVQIAANSQRANIDDQLELHAKTPTPEEDFVKNDTLMNMINAIKDALSPEDSDFFFYRLNLNGDKEVSYQTVAQELGIPVKEVKKKWSGIVARLNNVKALRYYCSPKKKREK